MDKNTDLEIAKLKEEATKAKQIQETYSGSAPAGNEYATFDGAFNLITQRKNGPVEVKLCNFIASIDADITKTDGINKTKCFRVAGRLETGQQLLSIDVQAEHFDKLEWLTANWGAVVQIGVGPRFKDHVAAAIKYHSDPQQIEIATHTGWIRCGNEFGFLSNSGAISKDGLNPDIVSELKGVLADYELPDPDVEMDYSVSEIIDCFANVHSSGFGVILLGGVFRSVLSEFNPVKLSIYLQGTTGTYKSALAGCYQSFFGKDFNYSHLPENWSSTGNAIEKKGFLAKDVLFVVDDFVARGSQSEVSRLHHAAERVLRSQGNQSGRDRLTPQSEIKGAYHPRGLILATGEDTPNGHSLQARLVLLSIERGQINTEILSSLQSHGQKGNLSHIMSQYIKWVAQQAYDGKINKVIEDLHKRFMPFFTGQGHSRMPDNLTSLLVGLNTFIQFAVETKKITTNQAERVLEMAKQCSISLALFQANMDREISDASRFIELIKIAVSSELAHIASTKGNIPHNHEVFGWKEVGFGTNSRNEGQGRRIGWVDGESIYIHPGNSLSVVKPMSTSIGNYLGSSQTAIGKALKEEGFLVKWDKERNTEKVTVGGKREYVFHLKTKDVFEIVNQTQTNATKTNLDFPQDDIPF